MIIFRISRSGAVTLRRNPNKTGIMKKSFLALFILAGILLSENPAPGKTVRRQLSILPGSVPETETLAQETMEFVYDYRCYVDTTDTLGDNISSDLMLLQTAAAGLSKFSSYKNLAVDSLIMSSSHEQITDAAIEGKLSTGEFMTIYKNYPAAGKLTHTEKICQDWFRYEEELPRFEWELTDSVTDILGYACQSAKCSFRGREWTVFYTEEIPLSEGPWKLHGLPGLIMKASDAKGHYSFECIGIRSKADRAVTLYKVPFNKVSRKDYYNTRHRYEVNPYAYFEATTGGNLTITDDAGNPVLDAFDPMELPFEYIERDWNKTE